MVGSGICAAGATPMPNAIPAADTGLPATNWFALDETRPLFAFAGIWRLWTGERKMKLASIGCFHADSNDVVRPIHAKAMPVLLTTTKEWDEWLAGSIEEATALQRPPPNDLLKIAAAAEKSDQSAELLTGDSEPKGCALALLIETKRILAACRLRGAHPRKRQCGGRSHRPCRAPARAFRDKESPPSGRHRPACRAPAASARGPIGPRKPSRAA
jgi:SOS response associated peptidase (SRAP)